MYLKRIKTNLFFDAALAETYSGTNNFQSFGTEITTDIQIILSFKKLSSFEGFLSFSSSSNKQALSFALC